MNVFIASVCITLRMLLFEVKTGAVQWYNWGIYVGFVYCFGGVFIILKIIFNYYFIWEIQ